MLSKKTSLNLSLWEILILLLGIITTVATSYISQVRLKPGTYQVKSDCPNAKLSSGTIDGDQWNNRFSIPTSTTTPDPDSEASETTETSDEPQVSVNVLDDYHDDSVICETIDGRGDTYDYILWFCRDKDSNDLKCTISFDEI